MISSFAFRPNIFQDTDISPGGFVEVLSGNDDEDRREKGSFGIHSQINLALRLAGKFSPLWRMSDSPIKAAAIAAGFFVLGTGIFHLHSQVKRLEEEFARKERDTQEGARYVDPNFGHIEALMQMHAAVCNDRELDSVIERIVNVTYQILKAERVSVMILSRDKKKLIVAESRDAEGVEVSVDTGIGGYVAKSGQLLNVKNAYADPRFNPQLDIDSGFKTKSILCAPIKINGETVGVISAINKITLEGKVHSFNVKDEAIIEYVASNAGVAIKKAQLYHQALRAQRHSNAILAIVRARSSDESVERILQTTIEATYDLMCPELVSVYLCDHVHQEAWICVSKDGLEGLAIPFGKGIAGTVAATGRTIRVENAYADERFCREVDSKTGFRTRSILCVAVPGFVEEHKPIAVIQLINKMNKYGFDEDDEEALQVFAKEVSVALRRKVMEISLLRVSNFSKKQEMSSLLMEESLLKEYGCITQRYKYNASIKTKHLNERLNVLDNDVTFILGQLQRWDLNPLEIRDADLMSYAEFIFRDFNLLATFSIDVQTLRNFIMAAHSLYHNNPFHNFKHGWSVLHISYQICKYDAARYLTSLDLLALFIAALCHDLDHPGHNNAFEVVTRSELALTYSDDSVLERHHASMTHRLLNNPENNILSNLSAQDAAEIRVIITDVIKATDMAVHFTHVERIENASKLSPCFDITYASTRKALLGHIVHCADLSGQVFHLDLALKWGERCIAEFRHQALKEAQLGLPVTPFMQGLDDELRAMKLQQGFVSNIVLPLWRALAACFPKLSHLVLQGERNSEHYLERIQALSQLESGSSAKA